MYLHRNIENRLINWKSSSNRKPLIIRGARQVGKTKSIVEFSKQFNNVVTINFERENGLHPIFDKDLDPKRIIRELETIRNSIITPGNTLLFFDEIQACPKALMSLRYFYEEIPNLHVIAAGSLLEFILGEISIPVGRVQYEFMYPLNFTEFLKATDREKLMDYIPKFSNNNFEPTTIPNSIAKNLYDALHEYCVVGGMPEAVSTFVTTNSFIKVADIQNDLIQTFRDDIPKYAKGDLQIRNLNHVFTSIFRFTGNKINYTKLGNLDDQKRTKHSLFILEKAMLCHIVKSVNASGLPLGAEASEKHFKSLFFDIGLGQRLSGIPINEIIANSTDLLTTYEGRLAEQFVGQQLIAQSVEASEGRSLFCWMRSERGASAEVDYVIARHGKIIPIEVKKGKSGHLKSLHLFLNKYDKNHSGICLQSINNTSKIDQIIFAPLFSIL